uniref:C2 domain-containing protein n=1 Tax=Parascaris univalens TaxID=6257 RepID=A0A915AAE2_PARUN
MWDSYFFYRVIRSISQPLKCFQILHAFPLFFGIADFFKHSQSLFSCSFKS